MKSINRANFMFLTAFAALFLALFGLTPTAINQTGKSKKNEESRKAIEKVLKAHEENWNRHDMDAWADAVIHEDSDWVNWRGGYWRGKAEIREGHWEIHRTFYKNSRFSPQHIEDLTFITPEIALAHVRSELSGDERAPGKTFSYRMTALFTKQNKIWRIRALHNTRILDAE